MTKLAKSYDPQKVEKRIYRFWEERKYFTPKIDKKKKPFVVDMPLPNITGDLHIGHVLNQTLQDILTRWHRLKGIPSLWVPGTDHAGIAMQVVVERELYQKTGKTKNEIGRKKFEKLLWQWKEKYGHRIIEEIKLFGASCDWNRKRFTMDAPYQKAVAEAFIHYYQKGYIYRDYRLINWCPRCQTVLSDLEVAYKEMPSYLWYIRYPLKSYQLPVKAYITVATTRPETMLGDTAVAVNPQDKRYKNLIGQKVILPLVEREIPIIADLRVDPKFGTGAVKVTPAHDPGDYEIAQTHNLEKISVIGFDNKMTSEAGEFEGLSVAEARQAIIEKLKKLNLFEKQVSYQHSVGTCERCGTIIEPLISRQWFVKMKDLVKPAIKVVEQGKVKFIPTRWKKVYLDWMKNIRDWCISRQLWWGHRIPVWYCDYCDQESVGLKPPKKCPSCGRKKFTQDPDVLDTWFSSALWPFTTLGWPRRTSDLDYFYPTTTLVTAKEIIFLWVARMIFSGLEFMKKIPFREVFIHAMVLDEKGKKMSKSLGNVVDPLELIKDYGADALRFGLIYQLAWGQDLKFQEGKISMGKKFCNKIWNAARFVMEQIPNSKKQITNKFSILPSKLTKDDRAILKNLNQTIKLVDKSLKQYRFGQAASALYDFFWHKFCDQYIEVSKKQLNDPSLQRNTQIILFFVLENSLKLLHPFIPFITEEIWQILKKNNPKLLQKYYCDYYKLSRPPKALIIAPWPR